MEDSDQDSSGIKDYDAVADLSPLEIAPSIQEQSTFDQRFQVMPGRSDAGLMELEERLESLWSESELFILRLKPPSMMGGVASAICRTDWIEMLDAWLPGLLLRFEPDVFAVSGGLWRVSEATDRHDNRSKALLYSKKCREWNGRGGGFSRENCLRGGLGSSLGINEWLFALLAHADRLDEIVFGDAVPAVATVRPGDVD